MKKILNLKIYFLAFLFIILLYSNVLAQPGGLGPTPESVPIDGGASLLLGAGIAYGAKKIYDYRKKQQQ